MRVALLGFIVLFSFPLFAQAKHPFTFEDMMGLKRVGEPVPLLWDDCVVVNGNAGAKGNFLTPELLPADG